MINGVIRSKLSIFFVAYGLAGATSVVVNMK